MRLDLCEGRGNFRRLSSLGTEFSDVRGKFEVWIIFYQDQVMFFLLHKEENTFNQFASSDAGTVTLTRVEFRGIQRMPWKAFERIRSNSAHSCFAATVILLQFL